MRKRVAPPVEAHDDGIALNADLLQFFKS